MKQLRNLCLLIALFAVGLNADTVIMLTSFTNASQVRKWDWVGPALEEFCRRNMSRWPGVSLYPFDQDLPDSAELSLTNISLKDKAWADLWRTDFTMGGKYRIIGQRLETRVMLRHLSDAAKLDTILLKGSARSIQTMGAEICKEIARRIRYRLTRDNVRYLHTPITVVEKAYSSYAAGFGGIREKDQSLAVFGLKRALELDPQFAEAHHLLGLVYRKMGEKQNAIKHMYQAMELKPFEFPFRVDLAFAYLDDRQDGLAKRLHTSVREKAPHDPTVLSLQGVLYLRQGLYDRAVSQFVRAMGSNPSSWEYALNLGIAYYRLGKFTAAVKEFERLVRVAPQNARFATLLGITYRQAGFLRQSLLILEEAKKINLESPTILINIAITYKDLRWYQQAEYVLRKCMEIDSTNSQIYNNLGVVYMESKRHKEAQKALEKALELDPKSASAYNNIGVLNLFQKDWKKALQQFEQALKYGGQKPSILVNAGIACRQLGKDKTAIKYLEEAIFVEPSNLKARTFLADLYHQHGFTKKAADNYQEYLEMKPDKDTARVLLGHLLADLGQGDQAIKEMEAVIKRNPGRIEYVLELAHLYRHIGWYEIALLKYDNVLKVNSKHVEALWGLGAAYFLLGETGKRPNPAGSYDRALYYYKLAWSVDSTNLDVRYWMGLLQLDYVGNKAKARFYWQPFLESGYRGQYASLVKKRKRDL